MGCLQRERIMDFRLTYAGPLLAHQDGAPLPNRTAHVHQLRQCFHKQLKVLWAEHPIMQQVAREGTSVSLYVGSGAPPLNEVFKHDGFNWLPMATKANGLICKVDILMLRQGQPGRVTYDIDNRLKTVFDALRKANGPDELGERASGGRIVAGVDEDPFFVLLEEDSLVTHVSVTADSLLEAVPHTRRENAVRLVIHATIRPYRAFVETAGYA